jgi:hypothetical protein
MKPIDFNVRPRRHLAALCAALLIACVLAAYPFAEVGINDDFSYIRSAKTLAETGHVAYYGWSSAMLGAQLGLGALFIKLFGFSFTATRSAVLLLAACNAFLLQRASVRLGLSEANATFATLALVVSPLFLPLSFSFMTDITALFAIVLCLYCCLRTIQAENSREAIFWLLFASVSSTVLGTARQTGWLGVLLLVPSTFWLVRRRVPVLLLVPAWIACLGCVFASLSWFSRQLYTTREGVPKAGVTHNHTLEVEAATLRIFLNLAFFLLPILIAFIAPLWKESRRRASLVAVATLLLGALLILRPHSFAVGLLLAPSSAIGSYVTPRGILDIPEIGTRPLILSQLIRSLLTVVIFCASLSFLALLLQKPRAGKVTSAQVSISWRQIALLLGPMICAYSVFLALRAASDSLFDRYLLPVMVFALLLAVRFYQERIALRLPLLCYLALVVYGVFGIAVTHDLFAMERARVGAAKELRTAGITRTAFYGGFGYDGWTQIDSQGYVAAGGINLPPGAAPYDAAREQFRPCGYMLAHYFPAIHAQYALSHDEASCGTPSEFAPVSYRIWLPPYSSAIYIRRLDETTMSR